MLNASLRQLVRRGSKKQPSMWISSPPQEIFSHLLLCIPETFYTHRDPEAHMYWNHRGICLPQPAPWLPSLKVSSLRRVGSKFSITVSGLKQGWSSKHPPETTLPGRKGQ